MSHLSMLERRAPVSFPAFAGERVYMAPIHHATLPLNLARWQATLNAMLHGLPIPPILYLMIDQQRLEAGQYHRRPGVHVDGYWDPGISAHGAEEQPGHKGSPEVNPLPPRHRPVPRHRPRPPTRKPRSETWNEATFAHPETLLLATDVHACQAFVGAYAGDIAEGGACETRDMCHMARRQLWAGYCYKATVGTLHESLPVPTACERTVVRINIPNQE